MVSRGNNMGNREEEIIKVARQDNFLERMSVLMKDKYNEIKRQIDLQKDVISEHFRQQGKMNILKFSNGKC